MTSRSTPAGWLANAGAATASSAAATSGRTMDTVITLSLLTGRDCPVPLMTKKLRRFETVIKTRLSYYCHQTRLPSVCRGSASEEVQTKTNTCRGAAPAGFFFV
jgi:hypothetical protein